MIVFCSLSGSPGVTRSSYGTAGAMATCFGCNTLLAECDMSGGDLAIQLDLSAKRGLISLAASARRGISPSEIWEHVQEAPSGVGLLVGLTHAEQSVALGAIIEDIATMLAEISSVRVLVDVGRLDPGMQRQRSFLDKAELVVVVVRPDAVSLVQASQRVEALSQCNPRTVVLAAGDGQYNASDVEDATGNKVIATVNSADLRSVYEVSGSMGQARSIRGSTWRRTNQGGFKQGAGQLLEDYMKMQGQDNFDRNCPATQIDEVRAGEGNHSALKTVSLKQLREFRAASPIRERYSSVSESHEP